MAAPPYPPGKTTATCCSERHVTLIKPLIKKAAEMNENLCKQISLEVIKYLECDPDAFVLFYTFPLPFLLSKYIHWCNSWNERLFIWYVRGMWLYGTLKMRLFANENQDLGKTSPTFFSQIIFMWKLRMSCSSCRKIERTIKSCKAIRVRCVLRGCQSQTYDREGIIDDIIMHEIWRHLYKKTCEKDLLEM